MGFGLIFLGWTTLLFFKTVPVGILGAILMLKGLENLQGYNDFFKKAKHACCAFLVYFTAFGIFWTLDLVGIYSLSSVFDMCDRILYYVILCVYSYYLFKALGEMSRLVGFEKGVLRERRANSLIIVFILFSVLRLVLLPTGLSGYLVLPLIIFELFWIIYAGMYIYSCYMMISTDEIIAEENKKMREYDEKYSFRTLKKK